jgi:dTDP-4-dehydrorhamnose 3,5-epimerase
MKLEQLPLDGAFAVAPEPHEDERGFFARIWSSVEFAERGLAADLAECSLSFTPLRGTLRGLHYQIPPHEEAKLLTCVRGAIWDVIVDLREESPTYRKWHGTDLSAENLMLLYVPEGFAHGFITLSDDVLVLYQISEPHHPEYARGVRWNDPAFAIDWPSEPALVGLTDQSFPDYVR